MDRLTATAWPLARFGRGDAAVYAGSVTEWLSDRHGPSRSAKPARAADLAGLPPTFLQVGALDLFLDEDVEYAQRLLRAGVPTELHVYPGVFHGFDMIPGPRVEAAFARDAHEALRRALKSRA